MKHFFGLLLCLGLIACGSGPCHEHMANAATTEANMKSAKPTDRVRVFKPDGSKQCGMGQAIAVADMQKELQGIQVYSSANKPDGMMHPQVCGAPTGKCNVYEIDRDSLDKAKKAGFKEWTWD